MKISTICLTGMSVFATLTMSAADHAPTGEIMNARHGSFSPEKSQELKKMARNAASDDIILTPPEGKETLMVKTGTGFGCDGMSSVWKQPANGTLVNTVVTDDGRFYMNSVFSQVLPQESGVIDYGGMPCDFTFEYGYLEGEITDGYIEFRLPQLIEREVWDLDMGMGLGDDYIYSYEFYALALQWNEAEGMYVPCDNQVYRLKIEEDGTYVAEDSDIMLGQCIAVGNEDGVGYSWQMNGDIGIGLYPQTVKVAEVPSDLEFETWNLIEGISGRGVKVAFDGDNCYIKGLCLGKGMGEAVVKGVADMNSATVSFPSAQFIGNYFAEMTEAYFIGYTPGEEKSIIDEALVLDLDAERKIMSTEGHGFLFSTMSDRILSFQRVADPYIAFPDENAEIRELPAPLITAYYEADEYYDAEIMFDIPIIDVDKNLLSTDNLFYNLILGESAEDASVFAFYNDEYMDLDDEMNGTEEIPFGFSGYDFMYDGTIGHSLMIYPRGYGILGVRTLYRDDKQEVYSPISYVAGYSPFVGVESAETDELVIVRYYNIHGQLALEGESGVLIRQEVKSDGRIATRKLIRK